MSTETWEVWTEDDEVITKQWGETQRHDRELMQDWALAILQATAEEERREVIHPTRYPKQDD